MNLPNTIVGATFKKLLGEHTFTRRGELHYISKINGAFDKVCDRFGISSITLGEYIFYKSSRFNHTIVEKELKVLKKQRKWGILYWPAMLLRVTL